MERGIDLFGIAFQEIKRGSAVVGTVAGTAYEHLKPVAREFVERELLEPLLRKLRLFKTNFRYGRQMR